MTNEELKNIYFGAYSFVETADGFLQAFGLFQLTLYRFITPPNVSSARKFEGISLYSRTIRAPSDGTAVS